MANLPERRHDGICGGDEHAAYRSQHRGDVAARRRPGADEFHGVPGAERDESVRRAGGVQRESCWRQGLEFPPDPARAAQGFRVDDEPALHGEHIAHSRAVHVAFWGETAHQMDAIFRLTKKKLSRDDGTAWLAGPPGQTGQDDCLGQRGECEASDHGPSMLQVKGIMISRNMFRKSSQLQSIFEDFESLEFLTISQPSKNIFR